jgi:hypothetical protein
MFSHENERMEAMREAELHYRRIPIRNNRQGGITLTPTIQDLETGREVKVDVIITSNGVEITPHDKVQRLGSAPDFLLSPRNVWVEVFSDKLQSWMWVGDQEDPNYHGVWVDFAEKNND